MTNMSRSELEELKDAADGLNQSLYRMTKLFEELPSLNDLRHMTIALDDLAAAGISAAAAARLVSPDGAV